MTDRQTAAERQAEGIADVLRERDAYRDALATLVAAWDHYQRENESGYRYRHNREAFDSALAAARKVVEG